MTETVKRLLPTPAPGALGALSPLAALLALLPAAAPLAAQDFPGVELGLQYENAAQALAVQGFTGRFGGARVAPRVEAIVARDLRYSDRLAVLASISAEVTGTGIDYAFWDDLQAVWLVTGTVEGSGDGYVFVVELHDVPFGELRETGRFRLPAEDDPDFRMAVHRVSDEIVRWVTGRPGMAATRIAFPMKRGTGPTDLWVIDSDGENLRRLTNIGDRGIVWSPAWHPSGERLLYVGKTDEGVDLYELDLGTGRSEKIPIDRPGQIMTPTYSPDGNTIAFAVRDGSLSGIFTYNMARRCCLEALTIGRRVDISPTYSPDGRLIAFNSDRLGSTVPQIYVMPASGEDGRNAELLSPYAPDQKGYYTSPEWSPDGELVAFHGKIGRLGRYHILLARMADQGRRITQLTSDGNNEDPSWAPDGRHLVFAGARDWGQGLFIIDSATGATRQLEATRGYAVTSPSWSPPLGNRN